MDFFEKTHIQKNLGYYIEQSNRRKYRKLSKICTKRCIDLSKEPLTEEEKSCYISCQKKILIPVLDMYNEFFLGKEEE